ncbi:unnamed protein product [Caenorhabditis sp. 36 PRJEB53466]|nr:unnamed protein product [Caenorhabditis sp. 36 PRJEB53466]
MPVRDRNPNNPVHYQKFRHILSEYSTGVVFEKAHLLGTLAEVVTNVIGVGTNYPFIGTDFKLQKNSTMMSLDASLKKVIDKINDLFKALQDDIGTQFPPDIKYNVITMVIQSIWRDVSEVSSNILVIDSLPIEMSRPCFHHISSVMNCINKDTTAKIQEMTMILAKVAAVDHEETASYCTRFRPIVEKVITNTLPIHEDIKEMDTVLKEMFRRIASAKKSIRSEIVRQTVGHILKCEASDRNYDIYTGEVDD